jgi:predicted aminopeptidase
MGEYQCNCGRIFASPEQRTAHMADCHVMKVYAERDELQQKLLRYRKVLDAILHNASRSGEVRRLAAEALEGRSCL